MSNYSLLLAMNKRKKWLIVTNMWLKNTTGGKKLQISPLVIYTRGRNIIKGYPLGLSIKAFNPLVVKLVL